MNTKMATKKKIPVKKTPKQVNKSKIEKALKDKDFNFLTQNKLIQSKDDDLLIILNEIWISVKLAHPETGRVSASVLMLFSAISEMFMLAKDRETRLKQKQILYSERIGDYESDMSSLLDSQDGIKEEIRLIRDGAIEKDRALTQREKIKILNLQRHLNDLSIRYRDISAKARAARASMKLMMYEVNEAGQVYNDVTTHLISKNEKIIKILKDMNLTPALAPINNEKQIREINPIFEILGNNG